MYPPKNTNKYLSTGHINAIKCAINNNGIKTRGVNIERKRLKTKNKKSKFLTISFTGNVFVSDLQVLLSISFIPKCFALPRPLL